MAEREQRKAVQHMEQRREAETEVRATARRVLIVDDDVDSAELLALLLRGEGHDTRIAHDGATAIHLLTQFCPDVAFLDIGLPGMDGFELARLLRDHPSGSACRLVAVTGYEQPANAHAFDAFLTKPVDLRRVVDLVLGSKRNHPGETAASGVE